MFRFFYSSFLGFIKGKSCTSRIGLSARKAKNLSPKPKPKLGGKDRVSERTEVERAVQMHGNPAKPGRLVPQPWVAVEIAGVKLNVPTLIGILILIVLVHFISIPQLFQTILGNT